MSVAEEILRQLGGRRFIAMTGAKNFLKDEKNNWMSFRIGRNASKANYVKITLTPDDLYTMEFIRCTSPRLNHKTGVFTEGKRTVLEKREGLWCDMLESTFSEVTGLETRMPNIVWG